MEEEEEEEETNAQERLRSENLTTCDALTPGTAFLTCSRRASSSCFFLAASEESPTRFSGMKDLRMAVRQFEEDLAKIAHSCAVVPLFTFALPFANPMALEEGTCGQKGVEGRTPTDEGTACTYISCWSVM